MKNITLKFFVLSFVMIFLGLSVVQVQAVDWRKVGPAIGAATLATAVGGGLWYKKREQEREDLRRYLEEDRGYYDSLPKAGGDPLLFNERLQVGS